jgi:hypothetical protein
MKLRDQITGKERAQDPKDKSKQGGKLLKI